MTSPITPHTSQSFSARERSVLVLGRMDEACVEACIRVAEMRRGSSDSIVSDYGLGDRGSIPDRGRGFFFLAPASRPALGPTQPPIQWVPEVKRGWSVMLTTHPYLVPRLSMSRSIPPLPPMRLRGI
jgi:hypothetical protein